MKYGRIMSLGILLALVLAVMSACGGSSTVVVNDLPAYPGATELKPGDSTLADTLAKNTQQITALSQSAGVGGKTEQKGYSLPADANWDAVKKFYDDKLKSSGWSEPSGIAANILSQVNAQNPSFQTATYQRGNQNLSIIRVVTDPTSQQTVLIFSLTTR